MKAIKESIEIALLLMCFIPIVLILTVYDVINNTEMPEDVTPD